MNVSGMHSNERQATEAAKENWRDEDGTVRCPSCGSEDTWMCTQNGEVSIRCHDCSNRHKELWHYLPFVD